MFVDVEEFETPLAIDKKMAPYRKGELKLTPDFCYEVLKSTNHNGNIGKMLKMIDNLPIEEQADFEEVVLSAFTNREQNEKNYDIAYNIAKNGGYETKLENVAKKVFGNYYMRARDTADKESVWEHKKVKNIDLIRQKNINKRVVGGSFLKSGVSLVSGMSLGADIAFNDIKDFPMIVDVSKYRFVHIMKGCCLKNVKVIELGKKGSLSFDKIKSFPKKLHIYNCKYLHFFKCDLRKMKCFDFNDVYVSFSWINKFPKELDLSNSFNADFYKCNFNDIEKVYLRYKEQIDSEAYDVLKDRICYVAGERKANYTEFLVDKLLRMEGYR